MHQGHMIIAEQVMAEL
ncbi:MAG: hypothetical protein M3479_11325, partial [Actinomycetota bacterium]|nr:hypothetical protein [Actinomycetota bacterium]